MQHAKCGGHERVPLPLSPTPYQMFGFGVGYTTLFQRPGDEVDMDFSQLTHSIVTMFIICQASAQFSAWPRVSVVSAQVCLVRSSKAFQLTNGGTTLQQGLGVNINEMYESRHHVAAIIFFVAFEFLISIVMFNTLLSLMVGAFDRVRAKPALCCLPPATAEIERAPI
jgi:hypothetical protein